MIGRYILLGFIGLAGGISVAGGVFAFISILEMLPRIASRTQLASKVYQMENWVVLGGVAGNILTVFRVPVPVGSIGLAVFGLFAGIFTGCLAMALAETLKVFPVLVQRTKLKVGLPWLITAMAFGKALGTFYQMYVKFARR